MRRATAAGFLLAFASGCIPSRDNPHDPSRAPDVRATFLLLERGSDDQCTFP